MRKFGHFCFGRRNNTNLRRQKILALLKICGGIIGHKEPLILKV